MINLADIKAPKLSISVSGPVRCTHEFILRVRGKSKPFFEETDVNWSDENSNDLSSRPEIDTYSITKQLQAHKGEKIAFDWMIFIAKTSPLDIYKVTISVVNEGVPVFVETYSNGDSDANNSRNGRVEFGGETIMVSEGDDQ